MENLLFEHPAVREVAVVAMPDPVLTERACAFIVPEAGQTPTLAELTAFLVGQQLAKQKLPERLELVAELPKTQSGKVAEVPAAGAHPGQARPGSRARTGSAELSIS